MARQDHDDASSDAGETLVAGAYQVDFSSPQPGAGGGLPAYAAHHIRTLRRNLMAVQVPADLPPRASSITAFTNSLPFALAPIAHGAARGPDRRMVQLVVGYAPPGPRLCEVALPAPGAFKPWAEEDLYQHVLTPAAATLDELRALHVTHRAIRPDNMFRSAQGGPVFLGSFWAAAPASLQPALYEPPYVAMCSPAGRGAGSIADDVYALGVTLLVLATGWAPMAGLSDAEIVARKLAMGSFAALVGDARLAPGLSDLIRGMLAEDPDHRPPPGLLADPVAARARRVAARPRQRVSKPLEFGPRLAWDTRSTAHAMFREPEIAAGLLRGGTIDRWLRRSLGDAALAARIEEVLRHRAGDGDPDGEGEMIMRAICILDPLAPLCWRGLALWPDAIGALLLFKADGEAVSRVIEIVQGELIDRWATGRPERCNASALKLDARQHRLLLRQAGWGGGRARLSYVLNTMVPLASPLVEGHVVTRLSELLPALEARVAPAGGGVMPLDREICAFIAARSDHRADADILTLTQAKASGSVALAALRILADIHLRFAETERFPKLCAWVAQHAADAIGSLRNRPRRKRIGDMLNEIVPGGHLPTMLALLDDAAMRAVDEKDGHLVDAEVERIDSELARLAADAGAHGQTASRVGAEIAAAASAAALFATVVALAVA